MQKVAVPSPELIRFLRSRSFRSYCHSACPERLRRQDCALTTASRRQHLTVQAWSFKTPSRRCDVLRQRSAALNTSSADLSQRGTGTNKFYQSRRSFTTSNHVGIWSLFGGKKKQTARKDVSDTSTPLSSFLDESAGLGRIAKPMNELKLRCTEFDENGKVTLMNGEFKKSELIAKVLTLTLC